MSSFHHGRRRSERIKAKARKQYTSQFSQGVLCDNHGREAKQQGLREQRDMYFETPTTKKTKPKIKKEKKPKVEKDDKDKNRVKRHKRPRTSRKRSRSETDPDESAAPPRKRRRKARKAPRRRLEYEDTKPEITSSFSSTIPTPTSGVTSDSTTTSQPSTLHQMDDDNISIASYPSTIVNHMLELPVPPLYRIPEQSQLTRSPSPRITDPSQSSSQSSSIRNRQDRIEDGRLSDSSSSSSTVVLLVREKPKKDIFKKEEFFSQIMRFCAIFDILQARGVARFWKEQIENKPTSSWFRLILLDREIVTNPNCWFTFVQMTHNPSCLEEKEIEELGQTPHTCLHMAFYVGEYTLNHVIFSWTCGLFPISLAYMDSLLRSNQLSPMYSLRDVIMDYFRRVEKRLIKNDYTSQFYDVVRDFRPCHPMMFEDVYVPQLHVRWIKMFRLILSECILGARQFRLGIFFLSQLKRWDFAWVIAHEITVKAFLFCELKFFNWHHVLTIVYKHPEILRNVLPFVVSRSRLKEFVYQQRELVRRLKHVCDQSFVCYLPFGSEKLDAALLPGDDERLDFLRCFVANERLRTLFVNSFPLGDRFNCINRWKRDVLKLDDPQLKAEWSVGEDWMTLLSLVDRLCSC